MFNDLMFRDCFSIEIPQPDILSFKCFPFVRSAEAPSEPNCTTGYREQVNKLSSFIDGTAIYGTDSSINLNLRTLNGGYIFKL